MRAIIFTQTFYYFNELPTEEAKNRAADHVFNFYFNSEEQSRSPENISIAIGKASKQKREFDENGYLLPLPCELVSPSDLPF